ncbi:MAG: ISL3 family transposase [Bacilli bacterium]|nr:ISL3 family transposase [Bacilli bacterium]
MNNKPNPNSFVLAFGLDPDQFEPYYTAPTVEVVMDLFHTTTYELTQSADQRECPLCGETERVYIKDRYTTEREISTAQFQSIRLVIHMVRFTCLECCKTFTIGLKGVDPYGKITEQTKHSILVDCCSLMSFRQIARAHHVSPSLPIKLFDEHFRSVPPIPLGRILCVDEVCMRTEQRKNAYAVILSDYETREICDIFANRQLPYLRPCFAAIREEDRRKVKVFVTDMYEGYASIKRQFFPRAVHCVDLFHVVKLMTTAVGKIRVHEMNQMEASAEKSFMKQHWRAFLCSTKKLKEKNKVYRSAKFCVEETHFDMIIRCCNQSPLLWDAWSILQELFTYNSYPTFTEAAAFVDRIVAKLEATQSALLRTVARTYRHWRNEIANGMARNQTLGKRVSNAVAEGNNNKLKSLKKLSNGLTNFERFRKRALLIFSYFPSLGTQIFQYKWR